MTSTIPAERALTVERYAHLPDEGWRTELVRGQLVRQPQPGYEHGKIQLALGEILRRHVRERAPEFTCVGTIGVITDEERHTVLGPDLAVVRKELAENLHPSGFLRGAPNLVVEVVSPSNRASEIQEKVGEYLGAGASLVWVIYPETDTVAVHASPEEARFLGEGDVLTGGDLLPRLRIPVMELFSG